MIPLDDFPRLTAANHRITSPESWDYNCIAWATEDVAHWWQPGVFWPLQVSADAYGVEDLIRAFQFLGYEESPDGSFEPAFDKVALYGTAAFYTHAARQLPIGRWTSKLGRAEDIEHESPNDVAGGIYGEVVLFMKRPRSTK